jgi:transposase
MVPTPFFPLPNGFEMIDTEIIDATIIIYLAAIALSAACPVCQQYSERQHSQYTRTLADLPCVGQSVALKVTVRRFKCENGMCIRKIFFERIPQFARPWARMTTRLVEALQSIGMATTGEGGARLAKRLHVDTSSPTMLRRIMDAPYSSSETVNALGIDDFSFRRGRKFGTLFVNLETHHIIDVLADREAESVRRWMLSHPEVEIVSRDRGLAYIEGVTSGAPQAIQVADRWHLLANLGDAIEAFLIRTGIRLEENPPPSHEESPSFPVRSSFSAFPCDQQRSHARFLQKKGLYEQVQQLQAVGMSTRTIAKKMGLARNTVRKYLHSPEGPPPPTPRPWRASKLDPYEEYLRGQWNHGKQSSARLYQEICQQGYRGSSSLVRAYLHHLRIHEGQAPTRKERAQRLSPRNLRWLLARPPNGLDLQEQTQLTQLITRFPLVQTVHTLVQSFLTMMREHRPHDIRSWIEQVKQCDIPELKSYGVGLERDYDAVFAAFHLPWSQGMTEGKVNKLKTLKRQMYGRASFSLLRQRLLHDA